MRSPVERLEEWCAAEEVLLDSEIHQARFLAPEIRHQHRLVDAYREILEDFEATSDGLSYDDLFTQGVRTGYAEVIEKLANAVNPEETPDE